MKKTKDKKTDVAELRHRAEDRFKKGQKGGRDMVSKSATEEQKLVQELQIHQIELEIQNEELRLSRAETEDLLGQYKDLYDFAPVGYVTLDRGGVIRRINLTCAVLLGEERTRLTNRRFGIFISPSDRYIFDDLLKKVFSNQDAASGKTACEVTLGNKINSPPLSGLPDSRRHVHIEAAAARDGQECRAVVADITQRKKAEAALHEVHATLERILKRAIDIISETIERKGPCATGHHKRIAALASAIASEMRLTDFQAQGIELAAAVYDIGLIDIPTEILQDAGRLEGVKLTMYRCYPRTGYDTMKKIEFPWPVADIILQHRECFDGSGFPQGIKGADILIEARVIAVADAIADLTSHRSYRNALPVDKALSVISDHSGSLYDPAVVEACLRLFREKGYQI